MVNAIAKVIIKPKHFKEEIKFSRWKIPVVGSQQIRKNDIGAEKQIPKK